MDYVTNYKTEFGDRALLCERWNGTYSLESAWPELKQWYCKMKPVSDNALLLGYLTPSIYFYSLN